MKDIKKLTSGFAGSTMTRTRYLHIVFSENIQSYDIPKFRAAVIEKSKRESDLFHNHLDDNTYIYRYPLIQYKVTDKKASLVCLNEATEDIHYLLRQKSFDFRIGSRQINFEIEDVRLKYERVQTWDHEFRYNIHNWIALNQEHFIAYKQMDSLLERIIFLQNLLEKHIRIFMEAMSADEPVPLKLKISEIKSEKYIEYKNVFHLTFSVNFSTNLSIPNYIGLGKGVSVGFGNIKQINVHNGHETSLLRKNIKVDNNTPPSAPNQNKTNKP